MLFKVRWTIGLLIVQQNMDDEICASRSCFESSESSCIIAISLNAYNEVNESIYLSK